MDARFDLDVEVLNMRRPLTRLIKTILKINQKRIDISNVLDFVHISSGMFDERKLTLFSIFKDEIYFCSAFFDHYRKIGVEQFLIIDDGSSDGTEAFLREQPDCVVLTSLVSFGEEVKIKRLDGKNSVERAGIFLKTVIPHVFLPEQLSLYADADEFLVLPPGVSSLRAVFRKLDETGQNAVIGPMVECFSEYLPVPSSDPSPVESLEDLLSQYPYFESTPLISLSSDGRYTLTGLSKSDSLFKRFNIKRNWWALLKPLPESSRHKTPILRHGKNCFRKNSHSVSVPVSGDIMLPFLHFVYTENFFGKIERARKWKSHAGSASKYDYYGQLVDKIAAGNHSMLEETSIRYSGPQDLIDTGHMFWPESR